MTLKKPVLCHLVNFDGMVVDSEHDQKGETVAFTVRQSNDERIRIVVDTLSVANVDPRLQPTVPALFEPGNLVRGAYQDSDDKSVLMQILVLRQEKAKLEAMYRKNAAGPVPSNRGVIKSSKNLCIGLEDLPRVSVKGIVSTVEPDGSFLVRTRDFPAATVKVETTGLLNAPVDKSLLPVKGNPVEVTARKTALGKYIAEQIDFLRHR